jgi:hypothetical protein
MVSKRLYEPAMGTRRACSAVLMKPAKPLPIAPSEGKNLKRSVIYQTGNARRGKRPCLALETRYVLESSTGKVQKKSNTSSSEAVVNRAPQIFFFWSNSSPRLEFPKKYGFAQIYHTEPRRVWRRTSLAPACSHSFLSFFSPFFSFFLTLPRTSTRPPTAPHIQRFYKTACVASTCMQYAALSY